MDFLLKNKKLFIIIGAALVLTAIIITAVVILTQPESEPVYSASGEAEAVMTTKIKVADGIWDLKRYSDEFYLPVGVTVKNGNIIVADSMCDRIQIIDGEKNKRIGKPGQYGLTYLDSGALVDGYRENALFAKPTGVALDLNGDVIICDTGNHVIRRMNDEVVITIAGNGSSGYKNGKESGAQFSSPRSAVVGSDGYIYVADTLNHCIRRIDTEGNVTLYAGSPEIKGYKDGELMDAMFYEPSGLCFSSDGDLYVADSANHCIRRISGNTVETVAGRPGETDNLTGYPTGGYIDGDNELVTFNFPRGITITSNNEIIIADTMNHAVRMIVGNETRTLAGGGAADQYYGSAENIRLTRPECVYADGDTLYISDTANNRVLSVILNDRFLEGRPSRDAMIKETGISTDSKYAYNGDIRVYIDEQRIDMGRVKPWNTAEGVYVPIRPLFEALGATVIVDEKQNTLAIKIMEYTTVLSLNKDYFILKGTAVTTINEILRLFPYTFEWFSEFSLIALHIPSDLVQAIG